MHEQIEVMASCLDKLGLGHLITNIAKHDTQYSALDKYLSIIKSTAEKTNDLDVLERLYFAGLIYA